MVNVVIVTAKAFRVLLTGNERIWLEKIADKSVNTIQDTLKDIIFEGIHDRINQL